MSFIAINNRQAIQELNEGDFALPAMARNPNPLLANTTRLWSSIKGMQTVMSRDTVGFGHIASLIDATNVLDLPQQMQNLEQRILEKMRAYRRRPDQALLVEIFHMVQLWGGRAGRNIYVMGNGFAENWNQDAYQEFVAASVDLVGGPGPVPRVPRLIAAAGNIHQFGVAFATKHARFWAQAANAQPLPIYDRIMARGCFGKAPHWKDYGSYVTQMVGHASDANVDVATLERNAFNQFETLDGRWWLEARALL